MGAAVSERTIATIGLSVPLAVSMVLLWRRWRSDPQNRIVPPLIITIFGSAVLLYSYVWAFDFSSCSRGRADFVCGLNENQGILTFVALLIAVIAVWVTLLAEEDRRREQATSKQQELTALIQQTVNETNHNLIHMAQETDRSGAFTGVPQLSVVYAATLHSPPMVGSFSPALVHLAETLVRVHEIVQQAAEKSSWRIHSQLETSDSNADEPTLNVELIQMLKSFALNSISLLLQACKDHDEHLTAFLRRPGRQDLARILAASTKAMSRNSAMAFYNSYYLVYRSSSAKRVAPQLRLQEVPLVCWVEDEVIPKVTTYSIGDRYHDMDESDTDES